MKFLTPKDKTEAIRLYTKEDKSTAYISMILGYAEEIIKRMLKAEGQLL